MNKIEKKFLEKGKLFISYITGGDPSLDQTEKLVYAMEKGGADVIEIGIPYSDPLADGPVIQRAADRALANNFSVVKLFETIGKIRENTNVPLVFLVYYNTIHTYGVEAFADKCKELGIDGLIVPDLPLEESSQFPQHKVPLIPLVSLNSGDRIPEIVKNRNGFVYCISSFGVTGTRSTISTKTQELVEEVKKYTDIPVAVGFGISSKKMVDEVLQYADAAIVGSSIVKVVESSNGDEVEIENFVKSLFS